MEEVWPNAWSFVERLGPVAIPLLLCSIAALAVMVERLSAILLHRRGRVLEAGIAILSDPRHPGRAEREEAASLWLEGQRAQLTRGLGFLQLIAGIAPMLGLLGTVLGMVVAFQAIADHDGPVNPSLLADGLWQALLTTVVGMAIALPVTVANWAFRAAADQRIAVLALILTRQSNTMDDPNHYRTGLRPLEAAE